MAVHTAARGDFDRIVDVLVDAYEDDPVMNYALRGGRARHRAWALYFRTNLERYDGWAGTTIHESGDGAALWAPPGRWALEAREQVAYAPRVLRMTGMRLGRGLGLMKLMEREHPREPHYYLNIVAVRRSHQGRGIGGELVRAGLDRVDREGLPAYLESSNEANLPLYRRCGFEVTKTIEIGGGVRMWLMWRAKR